MKHKIAIILLILSTLSIHSQELRDYSNIKIKLATIGPGSETYLRWGHFGIIVDFPEKRDLFFDYGNFSFAQDNFLPNFVKGIMTYSKYAKYEKYVIAAYIDENRTITVQELNLTKEQVKTVVDRLYFEIREENRDYPYDQFKNNCVSEMNELLNDITDGEFFRGTSNRTNQSYRDFSRDYVSSNYIYNTLIMFVLGSKVEKNITVKESLFLPDNAMLRADSINISNINGEKVPFVKNREVINSSQGRDPVIPNAKPPYILNLFIGLVLGALSLLISRFNKIDSIIQIVIGSVIGFIGFFLFFMSFFTEHYYIHNNWNLILVNPFAFVVVIGAILKLTEKYKNLGKIIIKIFFDMTLLLTVFMLALKSIGLIYQENGEIILLLLPLLLVNSSIMLLFNYQDGRNRRLSSKPSSSLEASKSDSLEESITVDASSK